MSLGHEIRTDLAELQLYSCPSKEAALTVALALREVIARRLGVDPDEMGFAAPEARHLGGPRNWSAVLFDRASGGAGFSTELAKDPVAILTEARGLLDCSAPGRCADPTAVQACPRCVLAADSQHAVENTDRRAAYGVLVDAVARLKLPAQFQIFGPGTRYEPAPMSEALAEHLERGADRLMVFMRGEPESWDLDTWPASQLLQRWGARGSDLCVAINVEALQKADGVTRRQFVRWAERCRVTVVEARPSDDPRWLACVSGVPGTVWGSTESAAQQINDSWAAVSQAPIVSGSGAIDFNRSGLNLDVLLKERVREAIFEVSSELDGTIQGFGARLKNLVLNTSPDLKSLFSAPLLEIRYSDKYLFNPLSVRLLSEVVNAFADSNTAITVETLPQRPNGTPRPARRIFDDWHDLAHRDAVLESLLRRISPGASVVTSLKLPHRRRLDFRTAEAVGTIYFDQGMGAWKTSAEPFDFRASLAQQIHALTGGFDVHTGPDGTFLAVRLQ